MFFVVLDSNHMKMDVPIDALDKFESLFVYIRSRYCTCDVFVPISKLKDINNAGFTMVMLIYTEVEQVEDDLRAGQMLPSTNLSFRKTLSVFLPLFRWRYAFDADII